jgi:hypothetical protein
VVLIRTDCVTPRTIYSIKDKHTNASILEFSRFRPMGGGQSGSQSQSHIIFFMLEPHQWCGSSTGSGSDPLYLGLYSHKIQNFISTFDFSLYSISQRKMEWMPELEPHHFFTKCANMMRLRSVLSSLAYTGKKIKFFFFNIWFVHYIGLRIGGQSKNQNSGQSQN